jgi:tetratricopeptide (TPR) repeat protein
VGLFEWSEDIENRFLSLQTTSVLRPGDDVGFETCINDLRHEARRLLEQLRVYHEVVPSLIAIQMRTAMEEGNAADRRRWADPRGVARDLFRDGSAAELDGAINLARQGEAWQTLIGLLARKEKEASDGAGLPAGLMCARVRALYHLGRWQAGLRIAQSLLDRATDDQGRACALNALAAGYRGLGQWDEVLDILRGVDGGKVARIHYHRALALLHLGRREEAFKCWESYFETAGPDPFVMREFKAADERLFKKNWLED